MCMYVYIYGDESTFGSVAFVNMVITSRDNIEQAHVQ